MASKPTLAAAVPATAAPTADTPLSPRPSLVTVMAGRASFPEWSMPSARWENRHDWAQPCPARVLLPVSCLCFLRASSVTLKCSLISVWHPLSPCCRPCLRDVEKHFGLRLPSHCVLCSDFAPCLSFAKPKIAPSWSGLGFDAPFCFSPAFLG